MYDEKRTTRHKKVLIFSIIAFVVLSVIIICLAIINTLKSSTIDIIVAPTFAHVKINQKSYPTFTTVKTFPQDGQRKVSITADGFKPQELDITLQADQTSRIYVVLEHETEGFDWYLNQTGNEYDRYVMAEEALFNHSADELASREPIISVLPYVDSKNNFRIDFGDFEGCSQDFCLKITDQTGENYDRAINYIRDRNFNPDDYIIIYENTVKNTSDNPIVNFLPYESLYNINYFYTAQNSLVITVSSIPTYLDSAVDKLKTYVDLAENGTIAEYNIQFNIQDFTNPFESFQSNNNSDPFTYLQTGLNSSPNATINQGTRLNEYYYTTISITSDSNSQPMTLRALLKQNGISWTLVSNPAAILTTANTPNVPVDILNLANN